MAAGSAATWVPTPRWLRISPSLDSSSYACRTVTTATPRSSASCVIAGSCAPSGYSPFAMRCLSSEARR